MLRLVLFALLYVNSFTKAPQKSSSIVIEKATGISFQGVQGGLIIVLVHSSIKKLKFFTVHLFVFEP